jgi:drug/metabolite transporter (DMT)-like permease
MILCAVLVSGSFPVGAAITRDLDPAALTLIRFALASLLFAPIVWRQYGLAVSPAAFLRYSIISAVLVVFFWCMFLSLRYTSALNTSAIFTLVPSFSGIYAMILNKERLGTARLTALFFGLTGALWIIFRGDISLLTTLAWNRGDLIFLAGCLVMGLYTPLVKKLHRGEPMVQMAFWVTLSGTLWLLLPGGSKLLALHFSDIQDTVWLGIAYLAIFSTIITFFLTQYCTLFIGPTRAMAYSYLYPGLVVLIDLFFGGLWPGFRILPGIFIVLIAMFVVQSMASQQPDSE